MPKSQFFKNLQQRAKNLKMETVAVWFAASDKRTPWYAKTLAVLVTAYAFSPIDLIPDFIPVLGYVDDLILIPAGIALTLKLIPEEVMNDARLKAIEHSQKPVNWWVGGLIILLWGTILFFVIRAIVNKVIEYN